MSADEGVLWGIHAGEASQAETLFLQQGHVAMGWDSISNLSAIVNDQDAFKAQVRISYPHAKAGAIANFAGQLRRFTYDMKPGDYVAYPSKIDRMIHLGRIAGPYQYDPGLNPKCAHLRKAEWLQAAPRTHFSQGALYEIGSAMTLFQIRVYSNEFLSALKGVKVESPPVKNDDTVAQVAGAIEESTFDFVLKQLAKEMRGHPLAHLIAHLLETMGYNTYTSPPGADGGIDIIATRGELGFEPPIVKVQVKSTESAISAPDVRALSGIVGQGEYGLFITLGGYTKQARDFAATKNNLRLVDGSGLVEMILRHYEQFDARYKGMIPLKQVYVPDPPGEDAEQEN